MAKVTVTKNSYEVDSLYQWSLEQVLEIRGLSLPVTPEIHYAYDGQTLAIVREATMDAAGIVRANIPNSLLERSGKLHAYVCTTVGGAFQTLYKIAIPVISRAKPSDWEGTDEVEVYSLDALGVEIVTLGEGEESEVQKVLNPDGTWTLRFKLPKGIEGYTPVRGRDYWTEADKKEIVDDVLAALPVAEGVSF